MPRLVFIPLLVGMAVTGGTLAPGERIDVGGYRLYFNCSAPAPVTAILENGGGGVSLAWKLVHDRLSSEAGIQVCSYDRAGLGASEPDPAPYRIERRIEDLDRALDALGIGGELVAVGASYGGWIARAFAAKNPERVRGLVYVDANSVYFFDRHPGLVRELVESGDLPWWLSLVPELLLRQVAWSWYRDRVRLSDADARTLIELASSRKHLRADACKNAAFAETIEFLRTVRNPPVPTVVITRGLRDTSEPWTTEARERDWRAGQRTLLEGVPEARQLVAARSGHAVPFDEPELIVEAVLALAGGSLRPKR